MSNSSQPSNSFTMLQLHDRGGCGGWRLSLGETGQGFLNAEALLVTHDLEILEYFAPKGKSPEVWLFSLSVGEYILFSITAKLECLRAPKKRGFDNHKTDYPSSL